nr:G patch domain-containing protein 11 [Tanacetum cinerariifolium]
MVDFGCWVNERWRNKRVVVKFHKAKGVLDQLENTKVVVVEKEDDDDDDREDGEDEVITEEAKGVLDQLENTKVVVVEKEDDDDDDREDGEDEVITEELHKSVGPDASSSNHLKRTHDQTRVLLVEPENAPLKRIRDVTEAVGSRRSCIVTSGRGEHCNTSNNRGSLPVYDDLGDCDQQYVNVS